MKKYKHVFLLLSFFLITSGCATVPISSRDAKSIPNDRLLAFQEKTDANSAIITVTRDEGFLGGGCYYALTINNKLSARFDVAETANFYIEPGEILLRVGRDPFGKGLCYIGQDDWTQRESVIKPGEVKKYRLLLDVNGKADIQRSN